MCVHTCVWRETRSAPRLPLRGALLCVWTSSHVGAGCLWPSLCSAPRHALGIQRDPTTGLQGALSVHLKSAVTGNLFVFGFFFFFFLNNVRLHLKKRCLALHFLLLVVKVSSLDSFSIFPVLSGGSPLLLFISFFLAAGRKLLFPLVYGSERHLASR